jgi:acetyl-CoA C-acetyltransferase
LRDVVIVSACRTPVAKVPGSALGFRAPDLGALAIAEALARAKVPGHGGRRGDLRQRAHRRPRPEPGASGGDQGGVPDTVPSFTVNKVCGSGLKSVMLAAQAIRAGDAEVSSRADRRA